MDTWGVWKYSAIEFDYFDDLPIETIILICQLAMFHYRRQ